MNQPNPNDKPQNHAHFSVLNKTKSTINPSDLFLKISSPSLLTNNNNKESPQENKKESTLDSPVLSPQRKKSTIIYQVCEGDTYESIASKFNISVNWLIRQNMKQILDPDFTLSKDKKLNVTCPSNSMIKPLDCVFIKSENDSNLDSNDFEKGKPGVAYIIIFENSLDFVPYNVNKTNKPFHVPLTSIREDVIIFTPKSQREKMKKSSQISKESTNQAEPENSLENNQNTTELASQITESLVENPTEKNEEHITVEKIEETSNAENITIEKIEETTSQDKKVTQQVEIEKLEETSNTENISENIAIEKVEETSNQTENQIQEQSNTTITESITQIPQKDDSPQIQNENVALNAVENLEDQTTENQSNVIVDQAVQLPSNESSELSNQNKETPDQTAEKIQPQSSQNLPENEKNRILVVKYKTKKNNQIQINTLYFRVQEEAGNAFSASLLKAIKEAKERLKAKKKAQIPVPQSLPPQRPHISGSTSSPLGFFQSIFSSIKDTFSHLNDPESTNDNNEKEKEKEKDQQSPIKPPRSNLYRRSFSEKTIGFPFFDQKDKNENDASKDDSIKPRRNSTNSNMSSSAQQKRKVLAASVLMQIKIIDGPSAIFERNEEIDEVRTKLPYRMRSYDWMLIYRLSRDGSSFTNFFNYTRNSGPVVFIMSTSTKERIGAFIPTGFKYSTRYYGSGEAFVFRFVKQQKEKDENKDKPKDNNNEETKEENSNESKTNNNEETKEENNNEDKTDNKEEKKEENSNENKSDNNEETNKENNNENKTDNKEESNNENKTDNKEENNNENKVDNNEETNKENNNEVKTDNNEEKKEENNNENKTDNNEVKTGNKEEKKEENSNEVKTDNKEEKKEENNDENNSKENKNDAEDDKNQSEKDESNSFAHIEAFKWTPGTNTNFMMSEKDTIIIGIGNDKDSYDKSDIEAINSSHGNMSGPAIWIGEDLQYASSSRCTTFSSPQLTKKNYFYVEDIEIWKIGFFSNK